MLNKISQTKFAIYATTANAKIKKHIIRGLKANNPKKGGGNYYQGFYGQINRLERENDIISLIPAVKKMKPHKTDKGKAPFLLECAKGYILIRSHYDVSNVRNQTGLTHTQKGGLRIRCHPDAVWELRDGRIAYVLYYLFKFKPEPDAERLTADKAAIAASIMAQKIQYNENSVFLIADLKNGIHFEIADDGSRLLTQISTTANNIIADAA